MNKIKLGQQGLSETKHAIKEVTKHTIKEGVAIEWWVEATKQRIKE